MSICRKSLLLLNKCKNMKQMMQTHAQIITGGLRNDNFALSRIMDFCSDPIYGSLSYAQLLFETIQSPSLCIWNTKIKALLLKEEYIRTIEIYGKMLLNGLNPDNYTLTYILKACSKLQGSRIGTLVHAHVLKLGFGSDIFIGNTLVLMYINLEETKRAREIFDSMPRRDAASWTIMISGYSKLGEIESARLIFDEALIKDKKVWGSMISGYVLNNCFKESLLMFRQMQTQGLEPDEGVFVSALSACARLGAIDIGIWIHHYLYRINSQLSIRLCTALIDMYMKCGNLTSAHRLFNKMHKKDMICWNVMILGEAMHGDGKGALDFFRRMQEEGFRPDETTFLAVLTACSHSGMIEEGKTLFHSMKNLYKIQPKSEHYGCVVDFLARAGLFREARRIIETMPVSTSVSEKAVAWRALLSGCLNHGEIRLAEVAAEFLMKLEDCSGVYVMLSNVYENYGRYEDARRMRKSMKEEGVLKLPGCSSIEIGGCVHEFIAREQMHLQMEEIYHVLKALTYQMKLDDL